MLVDQRRRYGGISHPDCVAIRFVAPKPPICTLKGHAMTEKQFGQWLDALKSGRYVQGQRELVGYRHEHLTHCCLGVLSSQLKLRTQYGTLRYPPVPYVEEGLLVQLNDVGPLDNYQRVINDLELAPEAYITEA